jgi:hypothetical protein
MVTKEPKTMKGMLRKAETGDGRKSTTMERSMKQADKIMKETTKWMETATKSKSSKKKK